MTTPSPLPPSSSDSTDKVLIILSHLSLLLGVGILLPLIVYLIKKQEAPLVADHAREVLNFHISVIIYCAVSVPLILVFGLGILTMMATVFAAFILSIIAAIKVSDGGFYKYPFTFRFIT